MSFLRSFSKEERWQDLEDTVLWVGEEDTVPTTGPLGDYMLMDRMYNVASISCIVDFWTLV